MHVDYDTNPEDIQDACAVLECLCEGFVRAHSLEISKDPEAFPCCVKCGEFTCCKDGAFYPDPTGLSTPKNNPKQGGRNYFRNHQGWPGSEIAATARNHVGWPGTEMSVTPNPATVKCQNPATLAETRKGSPVDLAVFQCAQERRRGHDCYVRIWPDHQGRLHAVVYYPRDDKVKDPRDDAVSMNPCACGVPGG